MIGHSFTGTCFAACVLVMTATVWGESDPALPTSRGEEAIEQLKQSGQYDSLMAAVNAGRQENGQLEEPAAADAFEQSARLSPGDGASFGRFGQSVAISGDTAIVGAWTANAGGFEVGSAYVFTRSGGAWTQQQKLTASDGRSVDQFGFSVAISGDTAIVGTGQANSAYVFTRSGGVWTEGQRLTASDVADGDNFGRSVAISGDTAIFGAPLVHTAGGADAGSAYVFRRSGGVWTEQQKLTASDSAANDFFGVSVAISGDTAVVGASQDDTAGGINAGSAYAFTRSGGVWTEQQKLTASDGAANDNFGVRVEISGDTAIVGAFLDDTAAGSNAGSAYAFTRSGGAWSEQQKLTAADGAAGDGFGRSVAINGDIAIVGAYEDDTAGGNNAGSAYVFTRSGGAWTQQQQLTASDGAGSDRFGTSVAISGDTAIVGAEHDNSSQGSAYVFDLPSRNGVVGKTLANISTRLPVFTDENVLIAGIIVVGEVPKPVIIRALGPSLAGAGVSGALEDPTLSLFQGETLLAFNDNWKDEQEAAISDTGVAPGDDREAAIVRILEPGSYTAVVRGKGDSTGVGLAEAYDLEQRPDSKLANISTRGFVATGENVLIGGFIVGPNTRVVVRAMGPSLGAAGVQGALQNPTLDLVNANGVIVRSNDNWKDSQQSEIEGSGVPPGDDREAALVETLSASNYTAIVRGVGGTTGVGLVEVYNIP